jgi:hypothetical protein
MDTSDGLLDLANRFRQQLRRLRPTAVGLMSTRRYRGWIWAHAAIRGRLEAVIMLVSADLGIVCRLIRQEDAARILGVPGGDFAKAMLGRQGTAE